MPLTADQIENLARNGADQAVAVAKGAGLTDPAKLAQVGADAFAAVVAKVAPSGPAQPAMPQNILGNQMSQSGGMGGSMGEPAPDFAAAMNRLGVLVAKLDTKVDALEKSINGSGDGADREPGLVDLVHKSAELSNATAERVAKQSAIPAAPRGASDPDGPREPARKGDEDPALWQKGPLGGFITPPPKS